MKQDIHPEYHPVIFMDSTTGFKFLSGSTKHSDETAEWEDGNTYPVIRVEVTSDSHPFYTGRQKFTQADGRVPFQQKVWYQRCQRQPRSLIQVAMVIRLSSFMSGVLFFMDLFQ